MGFNLKQNEDGSAEFINPDNNVGIKFFPDAKVTPGAGVSGGTGTVVKSAVKQDGEIIKVEILLDLTGLDSVATENDIIGTGASAAYIAQLPTGVTFFGGRMTCLEAPATGEVDIDIYSATEGTGVLSALITSLTETKIFDAAADWTLLLERAASGIPTAGQYLYAAVGTGSTPSAGTYTAGKFKIVLEGYAS